MALDSGERLSIITDEDTVQQLIEISMMMAAQERPSHLRAVPEPPPRKTLREMVGDDGAYPGGDPGELAAFEPLDEEDVAHIGVRQDSAPVMGKVFDVPVKNVPTGIQPGGLGQPKPPVKRHPMIDQDGFMVAPTAKTVPTDEMGYPITQMSRQEPDPEVEEEDVGEQV